MGLAQEGELDCLGELNLVNAEIDRWFEEESARILLQSKSDEVELNEKVRIYHHQLHSSKIRQSSILRLQTEGGLKVGHDQCARFLEDQVADLLTNPHVFDEGARETLLKFTPKMFTDQDNEMLRSLPQQEEIYEVIANSNLTASPGTDGIPYQYYKTCWDSIKPFLVSMV